MPHSTPVDCVRRIIAVLDGEICCLFRVVALDFAAD